MNRADALVARPHLGLQADGMRRYQYNPRVLDLVRRIPRGSDRRSQGPRARDRRCAISRERRRRYTRASGSRSNPSCADPWRRCYPLGGRAFHLLGDATTRRNWSAINTSFVERDSESALRGFDDHQTVISVVDADGTAVRRRLRRDYRDLVPLLRHRQEPDHPAMKAAMNPHRERQADDRRAPAVRVAAIVSDYARRSRSGHAAAIVIDPTTGDLLASVSYPWPSAPIA